MLLAWIDPQLQRLCCRPGGLGTAGSRERAAAEDLLATVVAAPTLGGVLGFRSIRTQVRAGGLILTLEEVHMHMQLLQANGGKKVLPDHADLLREHAPDQAAFVTDMILAGASLRPSPPAKR